jgi:hypothetical protein
MTTLQNLLTAGDTLDFETSVPDYPASSGWTLKYRLAPRLAGTVINLTATALGDAYRVQETAANTATWAAGFYTWTAYVEQGAERYTVGRGQLEIRPASTTLAATYDGRSQAAKAVDDLRAALAQYTATRGHVAEYEILGRRTKFRSSAEILELLSFWETELSRENAAADTASGRPSRRRVYLRSSNA